VLRSIQHTVRCAHAAGRWVGVCGEMAGDPHTAVLLVGLGVDELSVSCYDLPRVKAAIRSVRLDAVRAVAEAAVACPSAAPVRALVRERIDALMPSYLSLERDAANAAQEDADAEAARPAGQAGRTVSVPETVSLEPPYGPRDRRGMAALVGGAARPHRRSARSARGPRPGEPPFASPRCWHWAAWAARRSRAS